MPKEPASMHTYLFVLSPPYSGSTVLWRLLATSPAVSAHPVEGQSLPGVKHIMRDKPWAPQKELPWEKIKQHWEQAWDTSSAILLEKSPPNIARAFEIERVFRPSYFIAIMRDPYAFCEGRRRRRAKSDIRLSAEFWVRCATYQVQNIKGLKHVTHFRYEDFVDDTVGIKAQILGFLPNVEEIDTTQAFKARSVRRRGEQKIQNFNQEKIDRLSARDIRRINSVLEQHQDLLAFFGYKYLRPSVRQAARHIRVTAASNTLRVLMKSRRVGANLLNRTH